MGRQSRDAPLIARVVCASLPVPCAVRARELRAARQGIGSTQSLLLETSSVLETHFADRVERTYYAHHSLPCFLLPPPSSPSPSPSPSPPAIGGSAQVRVIVTWDADSDTRRQSIERRRGGGVTYGMTRCPIRRGRRGRRGRQHWQRRRRYGQRHWRRVAADACGQSRDRDDYLVGLCAWNSESAVAAPPDPPWTVGNPPSLRLGLQITDRSQHRR